MRISNDKDKEIIIVALKKELLVLPLVRFSYLYGSFLTRQDPRDIDVAVYFAPCKDTWKETQILGAHLEKSLDYKISLDVHTLNDATASFAFEIISKGRLLIEKDPEERLNWEAHTLSDYQDIRPMLEFYDQKYLHPQR